MRGREQDTQDEPAVVDGPGLRVDDLTVRRGPTTILDGVTFTAPPGARIGLVGTNGAGKSTLLTVAVGLARPTAGSVTWRGRRPGAARDVAFLAQGKPVYPGLTPERALDLARSLNPGGWDEQGARSWLDAFEVPRGRPCAVLSGGERTHVALALALGRRVPHLVLDEPFAELDPVARDEAVGLLRDVVAASGRTLLVSSHLLSDIDDLCDHVVVLSRGRTTLTGSRAQILAAHPGRSVPEVALDAMRRVARTARTRRPPAATEEGAR